MKPKLDIVSVGLLQQACADWVTLYAVGHDRTETDEHLWQLMEAIAADDRALLERMVGIRMGVRPSDHTK